MTDLEQAPHLISLLREDIRKLIDLSLAQNDVPWEQLIAPLSGSAENRCWQIKKCGASSCPAWNRPDVRCWLLAGTMCGGEVQGKFARKLRSCSECEVFQLAVYSDPVTEIEEHIVMLVHNLKEKYEQVNALALTDHLTGLYNRRYFELFIELEGKKIARNNGTICIMLIDVDNFKRINDEHGHITGDEILRECARVLSRSVRTCDILTRYGGDEFLIAASFLPDVGNPGDEIWRRVEGNLELWNQQMRPNGIELSLSAGYALLTGDRRLDDVIKDADIKMYESKRTKR
jgi:diguanylate cyclase (GGDEF)-like protein